MRRPTYMVFIIMIIFSAFYLSSVVAGEEEEEDCCPPGEGVCYEGGEPLPPCVPPEDAVPVPEGNIFTAAALVGSGLYLLWLKGRKGE
jgi:hypothetical protein